MLPNPETLPPLHMQKRSLPFKGRDRVGMGNRPSLGIKDYILKPIEFRKLITAIEKNLEEIGQERRCSSDS
jgi:FixJ family two-component response regulator